MGSGVKGLMFRVRGRGLGVRSCRETALEMQGRRDSRGKGRRGGEGGEEWTFEGPRRGPTEEGGSHRGRLVRRGGRQWGGAEHPRELWQGRWFSSCVL